MACNYTREEPKGCQNFLVVFVCPSCVVYILLFFSLSSTKNTPKREIRLWGVLSSTISPHAYLQALHVPPLESDWPLALDWNWLHKGYNNERLLIFCQRCWRCVKGRDNTVTRTTRFYISVLSRSQIPKIRLGLWSWRYCVSNWVVLIHAALAHGCTVMMNVSLLCWMKNWSNHPDAAASGLSEKDAIFWTQKIKLRNGINTKI